MPLSRRRLRLSCASRRGRPKNQNSPAIAAPSAATTSATTTTGVRISSPRMTKVACPGSCAA
jgi:hypothetical protein